MLNSHEVEYLVVGGHAVAFHGHPRFTGDIDFFLRPTEANARRALAALRAFGFGGLNLEPQDLTAPGRVVQLGRPPDRIDLLTSISGVTFEKAWRTRVAGNLDEHLVCFLGRSALLRNKEASGRAKDRSDVAALRAVARKASLRGRPKQNAARASRGR